MSLIRNRVLNAAGTAVGASAVDAAVSGTIEFADPLQILLKVQISAMAQTTGITFSLKDSFDGGATWFAVGSESSVAAVKKTFAGGTPEASTVTWPSTASATQGDYVHYTAQDGTKYAVWLDIDAAGTAPTGALYLAADQKIKVSSVGGGSAAANAALPTAVLPVTVFTANALNPTAVQSMPTVFVANVL